METNLGLPKKCHQVKEASLGMCPEKEWEDIDSRFGLLSGSMYMCKNFLLRSRCWEGPWASFHQNEFLVHQRVLKKSGLSQTESDETTPFSWSVTFCF